MFTCPVKTSINGVIQFNCETLYRGTVFNGIKLTFQNGKIIDATAQSDTEKLNEISTATKAPATSASGAWRSTRTSRSR